MFRKIAGWMVACVLLGWVAGGAAVAAVDKAALDKAFAALPKHDWGKTREALNAVDAAIVASHGDAAVRKDLEARLVAVLKGEATRAAKQFVCRKLAIIGTAASVDALATLLTDKDLSHMGRYALERMPAPGASEALRKAVGKVDGKLKVGMINSLGARRDAECAAAMIGLLKDADKGIATAAAAALGRIGDKAAAEALADFLDKAPKELQTAAVDANLEFAKQVAKKGDKGAAGKIYDKLYAKEQPARVRRAALQGLAMVRPDQTAPLVLEALRSADPTFRGLAVNMIKEMPGTEATKTFAAALEKLPEAGQIALLDALAGRKDAAARPAVLDAAKSDKPAVAAAAIAALGMVGGADDVDMLAKLAAGGAAEPAKAARASLARLRGKDVNAKMVAGLGDDNKVSVVLIQALAARSATDCAAALVKCTTDKDPGVRRAAIEAVGALGDEKQVPGLVAMLKATKDGGDRSSINRALTTICSRVREKATADLIAGIEGADGDAQGVLFNALGRCGGQKALDAILAGTKSKDAKVADGAIRVLCSWADKAAIAPLLAIAESAEKEIHQVLAVRGVVRLARLRGTKPNEKWNALSKAMTLAKKTREQKQVLGALRDVQTIDALRLVAKYVDAKGLTEEAGAAAVRIADKVYGKDKDLARETMLKVADNAKSKRTKAEAQKVLGKIGPKPR